MTSLYSHFESYGNLQFVIILFLNRTDDGRVAFPPKRFHLLKNKFKKTKTIRVGLMMR